MATIFGDEMHKTKSSSKKRRQGYVASEEGNVPKKRRKGKSASSRSKFVPLGEMARREEERLEKLVLGDSSDILQDDTNLPSCSHSSAMEDSGVEEGDYSSSPQMSDTLDSPQRQPAWIDEEDENIRVADAFEAQGRRVPQVLSGGNSSDPYVKILKHKFATTLGTPSWAQLGHRNTRKGSSSDDEDSDDELMRRCGKFLLNRSSSLPKGTIQIKRVEDLNSKTYMEGSIKAVKFHKSSTVGLVAGSVVSLYQVNGATNTKLHSVKFERYPVECADFTPSGEQFIVGSSLPWIYRYDMIAGKSFRCGAHRDTDITNTKNFKISPDGKLLALCGNYGNIHMLTPSMEELWVMKMNDNVHAIEFDDGGSRMFSHGAEGKVYVWDLRMRQCVSHWYDDGCVTGTSLSKSPGGQYMACGSSAGVVNIYESEQLSMKDNAPKPAKTLLNLTTSVSSIKFNPTTEIMAMASNEKVCGLRLVHFPSLTVFSNFPVATQLHFGLPLSLDFSPNGGYMVVGNSRGAALLYRLEHYGNY